ncbi:sulfite exporter TauE/SafE family protein [Guyparkeria hydrothermalis]|uniref:sulfite exporter TauE/SafE family protein n=1 Tax=Guyparkeria hydrothermalis TaxID=923 RepID=UPI0020200438|nr:sulfite exporter TauE/SafE family protein [Guyparkeria hydrothermalis]MCL7745137.1 sulfite exporter TauE/SafE family protein [Guyparkeria hydrothermalis]
MPENISFFAALAVGFFGGVHCVGMCGGIVGALTFGLPAETRERPLRLLPYLLAYNLARITSYTMAGAIAGTVGLLGLSLVPMQQAQLVLLGIAGLFMVMMGLYVGGWWFGLTRIERAGSRLWRFIEPVGRRLMPVRSPAQAFGLGLVWGWLPCGLVYSVLIWALSAGGPLAGALLMLGFGLGTLPNLLAMGAFAAQLAAFVRRQWVRRVAGGMVIAFGVYQLSVAGARLAG